MTSLDDQCKRKRALLKKLRQIEQLESKATGITLEVNQLEKIALKSSIQDELAKLG